MEERIAHAVYTQIGLGGLLLLVLVVSFWKLHSELTKVRVGMSYQFSRDLLSNRFSAYGELWSRMQATAIYTTAGFSQKKSNALLEDLSKWYFSRNGGLFLTKRARDFYFALQDLLRAVGSLPEWTCNYRPEHPQTIFAQLLKELALSEPSVGAVVKSLQEPENIDSCLWRKACEAVSAKLQTLVHKSDPDAGTAIYSAVQQVASVLRTNLTSEVRSRLDVAWPTGT